MTWAFIAALIFGGGLIAMGLLGADSDADTDFGDHDFGDHDLGFLALFSLRNLAWGSFAFGAMGLLAVITQRSRFVTWTSSIVFGLLAMLGVHFIFRALKGVDVSADTSDMLSLGANAELVLPFNADGMGMVRFRAGGQLHEMPARRAEEVATLDASYFNECRIEWIDSGVAIVRPIAS